MPFFTTSFPIGTDTGAQQQVPLRLNSSLICKDISSVDFPSQCPGNASFIAAFSNVNSPEAKVDSTKSPPLFSFQLCAPKSTASPWRITRDRQDIQEGYYLDFQYSPAASPSTTGNDPRTNFTQRCHANTTMGYFELPNVWNNHSTGPLLEKAPNENKNGYIGI